MPMNETQALLYALSPATHPLVKWLLLTLRGIMISRRQAEAHEAVSTGCVTVGITFSSKKVDEWYNTMFCWFQQMTV